MNAAVYYKQETMGERLRRWRKSLGLRQVDLGRALGLQGKNGIGDCESGRRLLATKHLQELPGIGDIDLHWLITGKSCRS